jgi:hypothetical protein
MLVEGDVPARAVIPNAGGVDIQAGLLGILIQTRRPPDCGACGSGNQVSEKPVCAQKISRA